jgi:hypothetical protein
MFIFIGTTWAFDTLPKRIQNSNAGSLPLIIVVMQQQRKAGTVNYETNCHNF